MAEGTTIDIGTTDSTNLTDGNGIPIPMWSETITEYDVMEKFPQLIKRFETGLDCLTIPGRLCHCTAASSGEKRFDLQLLAEEISREVINSPSLKDKVSLIAGGNIAELSIDSIVNATNPLLTTGKGVNGVIHCRAGIELFKECQKIGHCDIGQVIITKGYRLPSAHVLHTVGPEGTTDNKAELLKMCYSNCLDLFYAHNLKTIAFPCISTGQYCYPNIEAAHIALLTVHSWLLTNDRYKNIERIVFVTRKVRDEEIYSTLMRKIFPCY